jgi:hypothetical protein
MDKAAVFNAIYTFLEEQERISLTRDQFILLLSSFEEELEARLKEAKQKKEKKLKNKLDIKVEAPLTEEDIEFLQLYMDDYDYKIRFEGAFPPNYQIPFFLLKHAA